MEVVAGFEGMEGCAKGAALETSRSQGVQQVSRHRKRTNELITGIHGCCAFLKVEKTLPGFHGSNA